MNPTRIRIVMNGWNMPTRIIRTFTIGIYIETVPLWLNLLRVFAGNDRAGFVGVVDQSQRVFQDSHLESRIIGLAQR